MGLTYEHLFALCRELAGDVTVQLSPLGDSHAVMSRYETSTRDTILGLQLLTLGDRRLVLKAKAHGRTVRRRLEQVYVRFDAQLAELQHALAPSILDAIHVRELQIYQLPHASVRALAPASDAVWIDHDRDIYAVVMERLDGTLDDLDVWEPPAIASALAGIAPVHRELLGAPPAFLVPFEQLHDARLLAYQHALLRYNAMTFPGLFDAQRTRRLDAMLAAAPERRRRITSRPLTLSHGDFTPRNVCLRRDGRPCAYDWELAQAHLPERDVVELLCYTLPPQRGWNDATCGELLAIYRAVLGVGADELRHDLALAIEEFCTFKLLVQGITHQLLGNRRYFERLVQNAFDAIEEYAS